MMYCLSRQFLRLTCLMLLSIHAYANSGIQTFANSSAVLNLQHEQWNKGTVFRLDGQWQFYWHQLLTPARFSSVASSTQSPESLAIPGLWNRSAHPHPAFGYGTLKVKVLPVLSFIFIIKSKIW